MTVFIIISKSDVCEKGKGGKGCPLPSLPLKKVGAEEEGKKITDGKIG